MKRKMVWGTVLFLLLASLFTLAQNTDSYAKVPTRKSVQTQLKKKNSQLKKLNKQYKAASKKASKAKKAYKKSSKGTRDILFGTIVSTSPFVVCSSYILSPTKGMFWHYDTGNSVGATATWKSSDSSIVSVSTSNNGKKVTFSAKKEGTATVTATSKVSKKKKSFKIKVHPELTGIKLNYEKLVIDNYKSVDLVATCIPSNAISRFTFSSTDESVVKVDSDGTVSVVGAGTATIIVKSTKKPSVKKECSVVVTNSFTEIYYSDYTEEDEEDKANEEYTYYRMLTGTNEGYYGRYYEDEDEDGYQYFWFNKESAFDAETVFTSIALETFTKHSGVVTDEITCTSSDETIAKASWLRRDKTSDYDDESSALMVGLMGKEGTCQFNIYDNGSLLCEITLVVTKDTLPHIGLGYDDDYYDDGDDDDYDYDDD